MLYYAFSFTIKLDILYLVLDPLLASVCNSLHIVEISVCTGTVNFSSQLQYYFIGLQD